MLCKNCSLPDINLENEFYKIAKNNRSLQKTFVKNVVSKSLPPEYITLFIEHIYDRNTTVGELHNQTTPDKIFYKRHPYFKQFLYKELSNKYPDHERYMERLLDVWTDTCTEIWEKVLGSNSDKIGQSEFIDNKENFEDLHRRIQTPLHKIEAGLATESVIAYTKMLLRGFQALKNDVLEQLDQPDVTAKLFEKNKELLADTTHIINFIQHRIT